MNNQVSKSALLIQIFGYCHSDTTEIKSLLLSSQERSIIKLGGNFVIVANLGPQTWIFTSAYGTVPYFFRLRQSSFSHGQTVGDALQGNLGAWRWNIEGLVDLLGLEHLTGNATLHDAVERTPPASVLHWNGEVLERWSASWSETHAHYKGRGNPDRMVELLCEEVARCAGSSPVLSASGGFDSRVLLATLLEAGKKPELVVQGYANSTDRLVVEAIGRRFGLKVKTIELTAEDYLNAADKICQATSGTKPTNHWHTYIYAAKSGLTEKDHFFVGANGEFARSYYLDKGIVSLGVDRLPLQRTLGAFWRRKLKSTLRPKEWSAAPPELVRHLHDCEARQAARLASLRAGGGVLRSLDHFYLEERVRHFIGNGLALYGLSTAWRAPFLSGAWVAEAEMLPRSWKLGSNWHRHALMRLCPQLLQFPEDHVGPTMEATHSPLYWLSSRRRRPVVPYVDYNLILRDRRVLSLLVERAKSISDLIDQKTIENIAKEHLETGVRQRAVSILLGIATWRSGFR